MEARSAKVSIPGVDGCLDVRAPSAGGVLVVLTRKCVAGLAMEGGDGMAYCAGNAAFGGGTGGEEVTASLTLDALGFLCFFAGDLAGEECSGGGSEGDRSELMSMMDGRCERKSERHRQGQRTSQKSRSVSRKKTRAGELVVGTIEILLVAVGNGWRAPVGRALGDWVWASTTLIPH